MKKNIIHALILAILIFTPSAFAQEDEIISADETPIEQIQLNDDSEFKEDVIAINENSKDSYLDSLQIANPISEQHRLFSGISQFAQNIYNKEVKNPTAINHLLEDQLTKNFEEGPFESFHVWGVYQSNFDTIMKEHQPSHTKYNPSLINIIFDAKTKDSKDEFRLMLDPTPQHNRSFMSHFVQDLYYQNNRIPHHKILIGNSRTGVGYEGAQSPYTLPFLNRSQISRTLGNSRKVGLRVKGDYKYVDYDFGGYSSDTFFHEFFPGVEFDGWVNLKPLAKLDEKYGKLTTGAGISTGTRNSQGYFVSGAYVGYEYKKFWTKMEYAISNGYNGGGGLSSAKTQGWYITLAYKLTKKLEFLVRYDEFDPNRQIAHNNKREYTAGINYYIKGQAIKFSINYIFCQNQASPDSHRIMIGTQIIL